MINENQINNINIQIVHKEIDLIQACITRMANNSFYLKGWLVSLIAVIIALSPKEVSKAIVVFSALLITIAFWYLDAFFLRTEKLYRKLYDWVLIEREKGNIEKLYDLNPHRFDKDVESIQQIMWSKTLKVFYMIPLSIIIITTIYYLTPIIVSVLCKCR